MEEIRGRATLRTLQPSANVKGLAGPHGLIGSNGKELASKSRSKVQHTLQSKMAIFEDKSSKVESKKPKVEDKAIQTDSDENQAVQSIISDEITVEYWSTIAERRRLALTEALEENENLHKEMEDLKTEMESLKTENQLLKPLAEEAQYLAGVLKDIVGEQNDTDTESGNQDLSSGQNTNSI